jgi:AcrR family transcriptional regulator
MTDSTSARPGGRTGRTRTAVFNATLAELLVHGYGTISLEAIAHKAGVHKTTVYRRWRTKEHLVAEALQAAAESLIEVPDSGDVAIDLRSLARAVVAILTTDEGAAMVGVLVASPESSELARVSRQFWRRRLERIESIVDHALERGQLPAGTNAADVIRYVVAPLYHQLLITREPLSEADADRAAAAALAAARAGVLIGRLDEKL